MAGQMVELEKELQARSHALTALTDLVENLEVQQATREKSTAIVELEVGDCLFIRLF